MTQQDKQPDGDASATPHGEQDSATEHRHEPDVEDAPIGVEAEADTGSISADSVSETDELQAELDQARAEADQYRDQAVRAKAEAENVRKRAQRDVESARKYALDKFAGDLLEVRDSLEMGLDAAQGENADFEQFRQGMELTQRNLVTSMEKAGIEVVNPYGEAFDPERHEAVSAQPSDDFPPNTVTMVMQKGYTLNGRVLRAAKVMVAKAPDSSSGHA